MTMFNGQERGLWIARLNAKLSLPKSESFQVNMVSTKSSNFGLVRRASERATIWRDKRRCHVGLRAFVDNFLGFHSKKVELFTSVSHTCC